MQYNAAAGAYSNCSFIDFVLLMLMFLTFPHEINTAQYCVALDYRLSLVMIKIEN